MNVAGQDISLNEQSRWTVKPKSEALVTLDSR